MDHFYKGCNAVFALFFWIIIGIFGAYYSEAQIVKILAILLGIILGIIGMIYYLISTK